MQAKQQLSGVYVAAVTPLTNDLTPDLAAIPALMDFYVQRGCHGALLLGTTGEGPSFSPTEREAIFQAAAGVKQTHPDFRLLAGTGTPSLDETIQLNNIAFDLGFDGVVTLPPFYFRTAQEDGLYDWFSRVIKKSIPPDRWLLGYHFPKVSGVPLTHSLLSRLRDNYPDQFGGAKDSTGDLTNTQTLAAALPDQAILVGNDRLMTSGLNAGSAGCITALANLVSPLLREVYDAHAAGSSDTAAAQAAVQAAQEKINAARTVLDELNPFPSALKGLLAELHGFPLWPVKPPLLPFPHKTIQAAAAKLKDILNND